MMVLQKSLFSLKLNLDFVLNITLAPLEQSPLKLVVA